MATTPILISAREGIEKRMEELREGIKDQVLLVTQHDHVPTGNEFKIIDISTKEGLLFMMENDIDYSDLPCVYSVKQHRIVHRGYPALGD